MASEDAWDKALEDLCRSVHNTGTGAARFAYADTVDDCVQSLRAVMPDLTPEQRVAIIGLLSDGYCRACGNESSGVCHCENDE